MGGLHGRDSRFGHADLGLNEEIRQAEEAAGSGIRSGEAEFSAGVSLVISVNTQSDVADGSIRTFQHSGSPLHKEQFLLESILF